MQVAKMFPIRKGSHPGKLLDHSPATSISLSKLADESQLGSLSKLLTPAHNNNVNDCNYENWTSEVPVEPITNSCTQQYEAAHQYKSFMPLKKRFRQDFENHIIKESPPPIPIVVNNQVTTTETNSLNLMGATDVTPTNQCSIKLDEQPTSDKIIEESQEGRTTKFRACKGERYKIFMNTNRKTRNKTNRWDLRQKTMPPEKLALVGELELQQRISDLSSLDMEDYNKSQFRSKKPKKINKTKRKKRQLSPAKSATSYLESIECSKNENEDYLDMATEEKKPVKEEENVCIKEECDLTVQYNGDNNLINNKENGLFDGDSNQTNFIEELKTENELKTANGDVNPEVLESKGTVVGSRKRKLRKQNIMRLQPGSTFKDMRVVEDSVVCDLGTLAEVAVSTEQKTPNSEMTS
ncbi:uncharacterized protein [Rhodnius prolixus]